MQRLLVLTFALAACAGDQPKAGGKCGPMEPPCGDGLVCDMTDPSGTPVCIDATGDLDGDGIPNGLDFCEHMAGGAHDEDGDGIGDECDSCPIAPPPANPDPDGDAVESPCDPDPLTPGDKILLFDGFNDALGANWTSTTMAAWTVQGGELVVDLSATAGEQYLKTTVVGVNNTAVQASYRVDAVDTSDTVHVVAIHASDPRPAGVAQMECGVNRADVTTGDAVTLSTDQNGMLSSTANAFSTASLYRVAAYATGTTAECVVIGDGAALGTVQAPITADQLSSVALGARGVTARYQWVLVVGH